MKVGFDIHGVIDKQPYLFRILSRMILRDPSNEIHILTGRSEKDCIEKLVKDYKVDFTHFFSIVDHHQKIKTPMELRDTGWWMDDVIWNRTKGDYCRENGISLHFDNDKEYFEYFPKECKIIAVPSDEFSSLARLVAECERLQKVASDIIIEFITKVSSGEER